jgi:hypothetical protein
VRRDVLRVAKKVASRVAKKVAKKVATWAHRTAAASAGHSAGQKDCWWAAAMAAMLASWKVARWAVPKES